MEELNLQVSIANNGQEAVEAIKIQHFDLIFMDLQMPVMDGFEATAIIRQDKNYQAIPIIAMTAHAMQGDREKCLQAQMDDYLTKPIDVDKFFAMLEKWLGSATPDTNKKPIGQNVLENTDAKANKPLQSTLSQVASINLEKALERVRGKQDLLLRLLINFKNQKADIAKKITHAMQQNDLDSAKALVHSLKGEAGTLEATTLFVAAKNLEQQLMLQDHNQQQVFLTAVTQNLEIVLKDIAILEQELKSQQPEHQIPSPSQAAEASIDVSSLRLQLEELTKLLRDNNLRAKKLAKELTPKLAVSKHKARWEDLLQALSELDFDLAQEHLRILAADL